MLCQTAIKQWAQSVNTYGLIVASIFYTCGRGRMLIKGRIAIINLESKQLNG